MSLKDGKGVVLIVEDDKRLASLMKDELVELGYQCKVAFDLASARATLHTDSVDVVLCDLNLPDGLGSELISYCKGSHQTLGMILITAYGSVDQAVTSLKQGADDFLTKPINFDHLCISVEKIIAQQRVKQELLALKAGRAGDGFYGILGSSKVMQRVISEIKQIAPTDGAVLISGESGVGKELVARAIHQESSRAKKPFSTINCAAIPADMMEAEFFGFERGAFTGAEQRKQGIFREAEGGSLFLDEIGEMPLDLQAKLLRVVQEGLVRPLGSSQEISVNVRLIAASNRNLEVQVAKNDFREDLYYRLETFEIYVPPLRDRKDDIDIIAAKLLHGFAKQLNKPDCSLSSEALAAIHAYDFPGNVRELANVLHRSIAFSQGPEIQLHELPEKVRKAEHKSAAHLDTQSLVEFLLSRQDIGGSDLPSLEVLESAYVRFVLEKTAGNKKRAADVLGVGRKTLYRWIERGL